VKGGALVRCIIFHGEDQGTSRVIGSKASAQLIWFLQMRLKLIRSLLVFAFSFSSYLGGLKSGIVNEVILEEVQSSQPQSERRAV